MSYIKWKKYFINVSHTDAILINHAEFAHKQFDKVVIAQLDLDLQKYMFLVSRPLRGRLYFKNITEGKYMIRVCLRQEFYDKYKT